MARLLRMLGLLIVLIGAGGIIAPRLSSHAAPTGNVSTYMGSNARDGYYPDETMLNASNASRLKLKWEVQARGSVATQPLVYNGVLYWGSWDGYEHATLASNGAPIWNTYVGRTMSASGCSPKDAGPAGTPTLAAMTIGSASEVLFIPGGDSKFYALDVVTGHILWETVLGTPPNEMLWGGSAVYNGNVYVGISSYGDCPLTPGYVFELNGTTGAILHSFATTANRCPGAGPWDAPTIDEAAGTLYITTGTIATCRVREIYAYALLEFRASDLTLLGHWQIPVSQQTGDGDFGSTATLFTATINGTVRQMVGAVNKNGIYYAFERDNITAGPVWEDREASIMRGDKSSRAASAWDGTYLYEGDTTTTVNRKACAGSVRALNPSNGTFIWQYCAAGKVTTGATVVPGLVIEGAYSDLAVLNTATGQQLFLYHDGATNSDFWGTATVSNGMLFVGNQDGKIYAFGVA